VSKVLVIGISDAGLGSLSAENQGIAREATLLIGGERHLGFVKESKAEKLLLKGNLKEVALRLEQELKKESSRPVILASGDPLFYGIASYMIEKLGADKVEVRPYLSSMQIAFARAGLAWQDAELLSVHGRPIENLSFAGRNSLKLGIFTDEKNHPAACAEYLMSMAWPENAKAWVCENLEGSDEKITASSLGGLKGKKFGELNVLVVQRDLAASPQENFAFGLRDDAFAQRAPEKGLITKSEVRVLSLSKMRVFPGACVWDIGAATASVSIEAARLGAAKVWAVEKNAEDCANARENARRFSTPQLKVLEGVAPFALSQIPETDAPDSVFIGGTSGKMSDILDACLSRLKPLGSIVINTVTLENQSEAMAWLKRSGLEWDGLQAQLSRLKPILELHRLDALNPVSIFWGYKS
jgi:precorrin-6Y C5,15-methyltransferase (decarboxylating)